MISKIKTAISLLILSMNAMANDYKKPFYGLHLDLAQVGVDVRLNDIPVYTDNQKGQLTVDLPVPDSIIDGKNELKIIVFTHYLDQDDHENMGKLLSGSAVTANLYAQETDDDDNKKEILASISLRFNSDHKVNIVESPAPPTAGKASILDSTDSTATVIQSVALKSPFPRWAWQDGQSIEDSSGNYDSLLSVYKDIHDTLDKKDTTKAYELYDQRAKEIAIAYHLKDKAEGHNKISTAKNMHDDSLELIEFWEDGMRLEVFGNGKLARIVDQDGDSPVVYYVKDSELVKVQKFAFYKNRENKWVMIR